VVPTQQLSRGTKLPPLRDTPSNSLQVAPRRRTLPTESGGFRVFTQTHVQFTVQSNAQGINQGGRPEEGRPLIAQDADDCRLGRLLFPITVSGIRKRSTSPARAIFLFRKREREDARATVFVPIDLQPGVRTRFTDATYSTDKACRPRSRTTSTGVTRSEQSAGIPGQINETHFFSGTE